MIKTIGISKKNSISKFQSRSSFISIQFVTERYEYEKLLSAMQLINIIVNVDLLQLKTISKKKRKKRFDI